MNVPFAVPQLYSQRKSSQELRLPQLFDRSTLSVQKGWQFRNARATFTVLFSAARWPSAGGRLGTTLEVKTLMLLARKTMRRSWHRDVASLIGEHFVHRFGTASRLPLATHSLSSCSYFCFLTPLPWKNSYITEQWLNHPSLFSL